MPGFIRRVIEALSNFARTVSSPVWDAAQMIASGISRGARIVVDATRTIWGWWNTYVPRWIRWALYGAGIAFIVYLILGFGTGGIVAGLPAAWIQSGIGNVPAGHWFAGMQSLGATGALWKIMLGIGAGIGAALSLI